jgi:hypothetical protein
VHGTLEYFQSIDMPFRSARRSSAAPGPNRPARPGAAAEIHYGPSEDLEEIDVALIHEAAKQIDTAGYVLCAIKLLIFLKSNSHAKIAPGTGRSRLPER